MTYKNAVCRGSYALGTACGRCEKCLDQVERYKAQKKLLEDLDGTSALKATIARLTAELGAALTERDDAMALFHEADKQMRTNKAERDAAVVQSEKTACDLASCGAELTKAWHRIEAAEAERDALIGTAYFDAAEKFSSDDNLSRRICCDGHHCGCQGTTAADYVAYQLRALTPAASTAALDRIKAEAELDGWKRGRDAAANWHVSKAEEAMGALCCGSDNYEMRKAGRINDTHREHAYVIRAFPVPADLAARLEQPLTVAANTSPCSGSPSGS